MRPVSLPKHEEARARQEWPGSIFQVRWHNLLCDRIEDARRRLETTTPDELLATQAKLAQLREILGEIHSDDSEKTLKFYEHGST